MTLVGALKRLQDMGAPVFRTTDAALVLDVSAANASQLLARLGKYGFLHRIKRGLWALEGTEQMELVAHLTAPFPSYVSLHSALFYHGMISQIPDIVFCVSVARTRRYSTPLGTVSVHHLPRELLCGFDWDRGGHYAIATPEKALVDFLYLGSAKSRWFSALPEWAVPPNFRWRRVEFWIRKVPDPKRRSYVRGRVRELMKNLKDQ